jgi:hypothetical protein
MTFIGLGGGANPQLQAGRELAVAAGFVHAAATMEGLDWGSIDSPIQGGLDGPNRGVSMASIVPFRGVSMARMRVDAPPKQCHDGTVGQSDRL